MATGGKYRVRLIVSFNNYTWKYHDEEIDTIEDLVAVGAKIRQDRKYYDPLSITDISVYKLCGPGIQEQYSFGGWKQRAYGEHEYKGEKKSRKRDSLKAKVIAKFPAEDIVPEIVDDFEKRQAYLVNGQIYVVKMSSLRMRNFKRSLTCVSCGRKGVTFQLEQFAGDSNPHFNLYDKDGVLMTHDHIIPKSLGGNDTPQNTQTMCSVCNGKKGNSYNPEDVREDRFKVNITPEMIEALREGRGSCECKGEIYA
jgi:5-methylcytosine-specific restriction endonuclease McrA